MAAGAVWANVVPVASLAAGLSGKPLSEAASLPPAMREAQTATDPNSSAAVLRDVRAAMFEEGLRQIGRKVMARQASQAG
jgi:hypothetical protein